MADQITVDYAELQKVAEQFVRQASAIQQMQQQLRSRMGPLQSAWVGKGSDAFFAEMNDKVLPATARLHSALQEAGKTTRQIAQVMAEAERDAASPFWTGGEGGLEGAAAPAAGDGAMANVSGATASAAAQGAVAADVASRWAGLTDPERKQALQSIANEIAREYGVKPISISVVQLADGPGLDSRGEWHPFWKRLSLDVDNLSEPAIIEDVAHESRHAVQQSLAEKAVPGLWDSLLRKVGLQEAPNWPQYGVSETTAREWSVNQDNYSSPPKALDPKNPDSVRRMNEYLNQPIEQDARDFASKYLRRMTGADLDKHLPKIAPVPAAGPAPRPTPAPNRGT